MKLPSLSPSTWGSVLLGLTSVVHAAGPFLQPLTPTSKTGWVIGNDLWNITIGDVYGKKLFYKGRDLIGGAVGFYSGYDGELNFQWTSASIAHQGTDYIDVVFESTQVDFHWVIYANLPGAYQYITNKALPELGVLRSLFRLDNGTFTTGRTSIKDAALPAYADILAATNVQDETWQRADGSYITKYDFSAPIRDIDFHGVYGPGFGSWFIRPGRDYFNGNHLKQELTVHRETKTGDAVELNVVHGSHFQVNSQATFAEGKIWGPWLWYLNDGSKDDASARSKQEFSAWPYAFLQDAAYQSRGSVSGSLTLSNGAPAANASVFLGDNNSNVTTLDQGAAYYYAGTTDSEGSFTIANVRTGSYALYAWSNGGALASVETTLTKNDVVVSNKKTTVVGDLTWQLSGKQRIWQIGAIDRKATGFKNGGGPYTHGLAAQSPANLTYTIGTSATHDWYYAQSAIGTWRVVFNLPAAASRTKTATLSLALAGYSKSSDLVISVNGVQVGSLITANLASDPALYRSGTTAGEWRLYQFTVPAGTLKPGVVNEVDLRITRYTLWRGWLWDSVFLDWN
ncbi:rhamnogalacturonate lyase [Phlyctema vagabunda]|uniref:rhamnogalacturonan endolyase n=1 Tax=Phlyctema vagabunda TaxID=108571 RepID=A0ABR4PPU5_9HELO